MPIPPGIGAIDTMIGFPREDAERNYDFLKPLLRKEESATHEFPAQYMFKQRTNVLEEGADPVGVTLDLMENTGSRPG